MKQAIILSHLLDKYEKSKHLFEPDRSTRRVMLRIDKKELPEYHYQDATVRDSYNQAAMALEQAGLVSIEWVKGRPVLSSIILNLGTVMQCYQQIDRIHPKELAITVERIITERLSSICTEWIIAWRDDVCAKAREKFQVPSFCKQDVAVLQELLTAFVVYDSLHHESITMRAFSSKCYHDTKYFERNIRCHFLRIALKYNVDLAEVCEQGEQGEMGVREQLAYLGIYARPELYEISADCKINTAAGIINVAAATPYGLALPSTMVDSIVSIDLSKIHRVVFIENKTNYDEYILSELKCEELVVYHGGFLSPQKRKFFVKIAESIVPGTEVFFWADIDLGGFRMFSQLQSLVPGLLPMRMSGDDVAAHHHNGLTHSASYLEQLRTALNNGVYPLFKDAICEILKYGVTIEQETFFSP
jgi:hypothetical protein